MSTLKDPAFVLSSANTIGLIGVSVWLYKLNSSLAEQVRRLTDAVNELAAKSDSKDLEIDRIKAVIANTRQHVGDVQRHLDEGFQNIEYLESCAEALEKQAKITNDGFSLPPFPRRKRYQQPVVDQVAPSSRKKRNNRKRSKREELESESGSESESEVSETESEASEEEKPPRRNRRREEASPKAEEAPSRRTRRRNERRR